MCADSTRLPHEVGEFDMKPETDADEKFEWDMTAVMLLVLFILFVVMTLVAIGPLGHRF
jgi:hypothetical protein